MRAPLMMTLAALAVVLSACSDGGPSGPSIPSGDAELLVMNALTPGRAATLQLDGQPFPLPEAGTTVRQFIAPGAHRLEVRTPAGELLGEENFTLGAGAQRTIVLGDNAGNAVSLIGSTIDSAVVSYPRAALIRLVHAAEGVEPADAYLRSNLLTVSDTAAGVFVTPFVYGVGSDAMSPRYGLRTPGGYWILVKSKAEPDRVLAETNITLQAGEVVAVVLVRLADGSLGWRVVRE
jgi:hypothetical protein